MTEKKIRCIFTIDRKLKEEAEIRAAKMRMTFSAYLRELIVEDLSTEQTIEDGRIEEEIRKLKERMDVIEKKIGVK